MNNNTLVAKIVRASWRSRQIQFKIISLEHGAGNVSMLPGKIAGLACLRLSVFARMIFATVGRVEMAHCHGAVSVCGDGEVVDVVDEGTVG
jgi:hypothetical protein